MGLPLLPQLNHPQIESIIMAQIQLQKNIFFLHILSPKQHTLTILNGLVEMSLNFLSITRWSFKILQLATKICE